MAKNIFSEVEKQAEAGAAQVFHGGSGHSDPARPVLAGDELLDRPLTPS